MQPNDMSRGNPNDPVATQIELDRYRASQSEFVRTVKRLLEPGRTLTTAESLALRNEWIALNVGSCKVRETLLKDETTIRTFNELNAVRNATFRLTPVDADTCDLAIRAVSRLNYFEQILRPMFNEPSDLRAVSVAAIEAKLSVARKRYVDRCSNSICNSAFDSDESVEVYDLTLATNRQTWCTNVYVRTSDFFDSINAKLTLIVPVDNEKIAMTLLPLRNERSDVCATRSSFKYVPDHLRAYVVALKPLKSHVKDFERLIGSYVINACEALSKTYDRFDNDIAVRKCYCCRVDRADNNCDDSNENCSSSENIARCDDRRVFVSNERLYSSGSISVRSCQNETNYEVIAHATVSNWNTFETLETFVARTFPHERSYERYCTLFTVELRARGRDFAHGYFVPNFLRLREDVRIVTYYIFRSKSRTCGASINRVKDTSVALRFANSKQSKRSLRDVIDNNVDVRANERHAVRGVSNRIEFAMFQRSVDTSILLTCRFYKSFCAESRYVSKRQRERSLDSISTIDRKNDDCTCDAVPLRHVLREIGIVKTFVVIESEFNAVRFVRPRDSRRLYMTIVYNDKPNVVRSGIDDNNKRVNDRCARKTVSRGDVFVVRLLETCPNDIIWLCPVARLNDRNERALDSKTCDELFELMKNTFDGYPSVEFERLDSNVFGLLCHTLKGLIAISFSLA